jgi:hypothetical protein
MMVVMAGDTHDIYIRVLGDSAIVGVPAPNIVSVGDRAQFVRVDVTDICYLDSLDCIVAEQVLLADAEADHAGA